MSDTPRTDEEILDPEIVHQDSHSEGWVSIDFARQLERELQEAQARIRSLIAERDSVRMLADQNWKLRDEFVALLGTSDVKEGVREVNKLRDRIRQLTQAGNDALTAASRNDWETADAIWKRELEQEGTP